MRLILSLILLLALANGITAQEGDASGLTVYANQSLGEISPYVYGANFGIYSVIPASMMKEAQNSGVQHLRWGGGFSDERDLFPDEIDRFMMNARLLGAEPAITVRLHNSTPEASAEDVRYANIEKGYQIRYWSIGNEPTLFSNLFREDYDTERYNREWRAHAEAMRAVDPEILLVGPDLHQYPGVPGANPVDSSGRDWLVEFLKANGDLVDILSVHRYPFPRSQAAPVITIDDLRNNTREWDDRIIPGLRSAMVATIGRELPIAIGEINSSWANNTGGEATLDSHYNAIWYADILGRLIRQQVFAVAYWNLAQPDRNFGILANYAVRPVYYTFQMYKMFGSEALFTESDDALVSVFAARRDDGALTVMVVNLGDAPSTKALHFAGFEPDAEFEHWLFDTEHKASLIGLENFTGEITVPGQSVSLFVFTSGGQ